MELRIPWQGRDWRQHSRLVIWRKRFCFFQCHKLKQGLGSASGRLSSPLMVCRESSRIARFSTSPLPSVRVRTGLKVERIWRAQCGWAAHRYTLTHGAVVHALLGGLRGKERVSLKKKSPVSLQLRALTMEMQRWTTRWRTKRWLWDSTLTAAVAVVLILQAVIVRAGKKLTPEWPPVRQAGSQSVRGRPSALMTQKLSLPHASNAYCRLYQPEQLICVC